GHSLFVRLEEVLAQLRTDVLEDKAQMRGNWVIAQNRMLALREVAYPKDSETAEKSERQEEVGQAGGLAPHECCEGGGAGKSDGKQNVARTKWKDQQAHVIVLLTEVGSIRCTP